MKNLTIILINDKQKVCVGEYKNVCEIEKKMFTVALTEMIKFWKFDVC